MKVAVVTGSGRRFGLALCEHLVKQGWFVYAVTRMRNAALAAIEGNHLQVIAVGQYEGVQADAIVSQVRAKGRLDLLVNNASLFDKDKHHEEDAETFFQELFSTHMLFPYLLSYKAQELLKQSDNGLIVNITDIYAQNPNKDFSMYCSTKAGLQNLTLALAKKFAPHIRVNSIQPGPVEFLPTHTQQAIDSVQQETLLPVAPGFGPLLKAVDFLIDNHFVTGTPIVVDGGRVIGK